MDGFNERYDGQNFAKCSQEEKKIFYDKWASLYDTDYGADQRSGPSAVAAGLGACVVDEEQRKSVKILDVAAGTGVVALELKKLGFTEIDALDPSSGMLDLARAKGVYKKILCQFLTDKPSDIPTGSYDCVVMCSAIGSGHLPAGAFKEIQRITRPGGFVLLCANTKNLHEEYGDCRQEFFQVFDTLEAQGKWVKVTEKRVPKYSWDADGILLTFRVC